MRKHATLSVTNSAAQRPDLNESENGSILLGLNYIDFGFSNGFLSGVAVN